jgi:hypothetical protein
MTAIDKLIIYPREFNKLVKLGFLDSRYLISCDICSEKDHLQEQVKIMKEALIFYANGDSHYDAKYEWDVLDHHRERGTATKPSGEFALKTLKKMMELNK